MLRGSHVPFNDEAFPPKTEISLAFPFRILLLSIFKDLQADSLLKDASFSIFLYPSPVFISCAHEKWILRRCMMCKKGIMSLEFAAWPR
jgi:hypothetical protein